MAAGFCIFRAQFFSDPVHVRPVWGRHFQQAVGKVGWERAEYGGAFGFRETFAAVLNEQAGLEANGLAEAGVAERKPMGFPRFSMRISSPDSPSQASTLEKLFRRSRTMTGFMWADCVHIEDLSMMRKSRTGFPVRPF